MEKYDSKGFYSSVKKACIVAVGLAALACGGCSNYSDKYTIGPKGLDSYEGPLIIPNEK